MDILEALVQALVQQISRRSRYFVQPAVLAAQPALPDIAALHVQRAAGDVDLGAGATHQLAARHGDDATHRRPFADAMLGGAQIAAHFQQASRRIPALPLVAVDALGDLDQRAPVHPDIGVVQCLAVPADRRIALFVALDIDFDVVRLHGELDADRAGHVQDRAVFQQGAARRTPRSGRRSPGPSRRLPPAPFRRWSPRCATGRAGPARSSDDRTPVPPRDSRLPRLPEAARHRAGHPARARRLPQAELPWPNRGPARSCRRYRWPS